MFQFANVFRTQLMSLRLNAMETTRTLIVNIVVIILCFMCVAADIDERIRLLDRRMEELKLNRNEDLKEIELRLRKELNTDGLREAQDEIVKLRKELDQLRSQQFHEQLASPRQEMNERLTMKWLSNSLQELRNEMHDLQNAVNSTVILENREQIDSELNLLKRDVSELSREFETSKRKDVQHESELMLVRDELESTKDHCKTTAVTCGRTKNQLKAVQLEWNHNWKILNEKKIEMPDDTNKPARHRHALKRHLSELEKTSSGLRKENEQLRTQLLKLEEELRLLRDYVTHKEEPEFYDRIEGNQIEDYIRSKKIVRVENDEERWENLTRQQEINGETLMNLTQQMSNFDKLHMSMLELLENVENIENKVDTSLPEFRKEISKMEVQVAECTSQISLLREDQTNTRSSVKAISVSVSNMKDKTDSDREKLGSIVGQVETLLKSASVQNSKLHDHILKEESLTADTNTTKSTIHLVQELKSFENEYKNIVNKLPHDCGAVSGPNGVYMISPGDGEPILAACRDGWTTVQRRYDGSVDFNRNWNDYSNGFGSATGEHWLGNRNLHHLTSSNCTRLQINMKDIYGKYWQANYDHIEIGDYSVGFRLTVDGYAGNASDALDYQNRMEFSTVDNDRDISNTHCASNYEGGWWFSHCQHANLNGRYNLGLTWFDSARNEWIAVSECEMRLKRRHDC